MDASEARSRIFHCDDMESLRSVAHIMADGMETLERQNELLTKENRALWVLNRNQQAGMEEMARMAGERRIGTWRARLDRWKRMLFN